MTSTDKRQVDRDAVEALRAKVHAARRHLRDVIMASPGRLTPAFGEANIRVQQLEDELEDLVNGIAEKAPANRRTYIITAKEE